MQEKLPRGRPVFFAVSPAAGRPVPVIHRAAASRSTVKACIFFTRTLQFTTACYIAACRAAKVPAPWEAGKVSGAARHGAPGFSDPRLTTRVLSGGSNPPAPPARLVASAFLVEGARRRRNRRPAPGPCGWAGKKPRADLKSRPVCRQLQGEGKRPAGTTIRRLFFPTLEC